MLDLIRNNRKAMLVLLVLLVIPAFVYFGVGPSGPSANSNDLAHIGRLKITYGHLDNRLQLIRRNNPNVDFRQLEQPEVKMEVLRGIISDTLWQASAEKHRLVVTDQALLQSLKQHGAVQDLVDENGKLDSQAYKAEILSRTGYQAVDFENSIIRPDIMVERMQLPTNYAFTSKIDVDQFMRFADSQYILRKQVFDAQLYTDEVSITDEEVATAYESYKSLFVVPAQLEVEYVVFDTASLSKNITDDAIRTYYEQNKASFNLQEERKVSHILFEGENSKQRADQVLQELKADTSRFAELAKTHSDDPTSSEKGGDLGYLAIGSLAPLDGVAFSLAQAGDISDAIQSPFGYHIVMLTDIRKPSNFEEARPFVESRIRQEIAASLSGSAVERFVAEVNANGDSFESIAKEFNLEVKRTANLTQLPNASNSGALGNADFLAAIFNEKAIDSHKNIMPVKVAATQLASARVLNHTPESIKPLSEVDEQIKAILTQEKALVQAQVHAQEALTQWQANPEKANDSEEVSFSQSEVMQWLAALQQQQVEPNVGILLQEMFVIAEKAFQYSPASEFPTAFIVEQANKGYILLQLQDIKSPEALNESQRMQRAIGLGEVMGSSQKDAYTRHMEKEFDVGIYEQTMTRLSTN